MSARLEEAIGLSTAYRQLWARDLHRLSVRDEMLNGPFTERLDDESRALLALSCDLSIYVADQRLSPFLEIDAQGALSLLPNATRDALRRFGFPVDPGASNDPLSLYLENEWRTCFGLAYLEEVELTGLAHRDVVDAGSYDGASAKFFLENYPVDRVLCFEPDPRNFEQLEANTRQCVDQGRVVLTQSALSDRIGLASISPAGVGSSRAKAEVAPEATILVKTTTLDSQVSAISDANIGLIKLDVEGDAVPALEGATKTIQTHRPILIVSFYHTPEEFSQTPFYLLNAFPDYEFRIRKATPNLFKETIIIGVPKSH